VYVLSGTSTGHAFDDLGKPMAGAGKGIEDVLTLAATLLNGMFTRLGTAYGTCDLRLQSQFPVIQSAT
jgi:hypothetical protein